MFELITGLSYWVIAALWLVILGLYLLSLRHYKKADAAIGVLLTILAVDAFRTLFESAYFGLYFNSQFGFLPAGIEATLGRPALLLIPKLINLAAAVLVLSLLIRRWLPRVLRERKEQVQLLATTEEQYRDFVELSDEVVTRTDANGRFSFVNSKAREVFGLPPAECIGLNAMDFIHPDDHPKLIAAAAAWTRDKSRHVTHENRQVSRSGQIRHVLWTVSPHFDASGEITHINNVGRDITERKRGEEQRQLLATAVEQSAESIVITDVVGKMQYVNPAFEERSGYPRDEAIGANLQILRSGHHDKAFFDEMWDTLMSGRVWSGRQINRRKDGSLYEEESTISGVKDADGRIIHYVAVKRDVTREAELEAQLLQKQKLEAMGTLAGGIAHDFNNLLQMILGNLELAQEETEPGSRLEGYLDRMGTAGERAANLVSQILTFSRKSRKERKLLRLDVVLDEVLGLLRPSLPATIEIRQSIDRATGPVLADPTEVHQIAMNLCTNAYHAMREGDGVLEVTLQEVVLDASSAARTAAMEGGRAARLSVSDTGVGMDATTQKRIFDPYFTTKEVGEGTGLGMATVQGIVESCGGSVMIESEPGVGTRLDVFLPLAGERMSGKPQAPSYERALLSGTGCLMVVDDEPMVAELASLGLTGLGYQVSMHTSSLEALEAFRRTPERFDVVITDQTMPGMTGFELARTLLTIRADIPIVLCTGYSDLVDEARARAAGIRRYFEKPVPLRELAAAVRDILDEEA